MFPFEMDRAAHQATDNTWYSISVTVAPESAEAIEYAFNSLEALGTEINHLRKKNAESVTVVGYFNELPDDERFQDELHYALQVYGFTEESALQVERNKIENTDWLAEWKKHWKPSDVGAFVIAPPWSEVDQPEKIVIRIEPNMAFGTGTHETTQLCLRAIEKYYQPGDSFLDVGTGTGILAIAATKLNLRSQVSNLKLRACDTDVDSISIAKENAALNEVGESVDFYIGSIDEAMPAFDFVCANLTLDVIKPLLPLLIEKVEKTIVLSGILVEQRDEIVAALKDLDINESEITSAGEWISVVIGKEF
jgi:ribosomal protein L11 methyltransferase